MCLLVFVPKHFRTIVRDRVFIVPASVVSESLVVSVVSCTVIPCRPVVVSVSVCVSLVLSIVPMLMTGGTEKQHMQRPESLCFSEPPALSVPVGKNWWTPRFQGPCVSVLKTCVGPDFRLWFLSRGSLA